PIFEAISYTWADEDGNADLCEPIYLGPELQVLLVTKNCSRALRRFRKSINRLLWIDAICINQADVVERENQVRLMGSVYAQASRVIVYLGKGNSNIMAAMRSLT
ncbi:heterokaryon incompatibility, partial [Lophiotrema nucula]